MREEEGSREERRVKGEGRKKGRGEERQRGEEKEGEGREGRGGGSRRRVCHSQLGGLAAPQVFLSSSGTTDSPGPRLCLFVTRDTVLPAYK